MKLKKRYLENFAAKFLEKRMVFVGGPRGGGKTTLCLKFLDPPHFQTPAYLNWNDSESRDLIKKGDLPDDKIVVFKDLHKYRHWRNLIKGFFDKRKDLQKYLVTGSARLDLYRRGGDSLMGRYRYLRLHPFSIGELGLTTKEEVEQLLKFGGFPEPFFTADENEWRLWQHLAFGRDSA
jgi:hypothetical protein